MLGMPCPCRRLFVSLCFPTPATYTLHLSPSTRSRRAVFGPEMEQLERLAGHGTVSIAYGRPAYNGLLMVSMLLHPAGMTGMPPAGHARAIQGVAPGGGLGADLGANMGADLGTTCYFQPAKCPASCTRHRDPRGSARVADHRQPAQCLRRLPARPRRRAPTRTGSPHGAPIPGSLFLPSAVARIRDLVAGMKERRGPRPLPAPRRRRPAARGGGAALGVPRPAGSGGGVRDRSQRRGVAPAAVGQTARRLHQDLSGPSVGDPQGAGGSGGAGACARPAALAGPAPVLRRLRRGVRTAERRPRDALRRLREPGWAHRHDHAGDPRRPRPAGSPQRFPRANVCSTLAASWTGRRTSRKRSAARWRRKPGVTVGAVSSRFSSQALAVSRRRWLPRPPTAGLSEDITVRTPRN